MLEFYCKMKFEVIQISILVLFIVALWWIRFAYQELHSNLKLETFQHVKHEAKMNVPCIRGVNTARNAMKGYADYANSAIMN